MNPGQKIIKVCATILAVFLAVSIIGSVLFGIFIALQASSPDSGPKIGNSGKQQEQSSYNTFDFSHSFTGIDSLEIDSTIQNIIIQSGSEIRVDMENVSTECTAYQDGSVLIIEDNTSNINGQFLNWMGDFLDGKTKLIGGTITITLPESFTAESCYINSGTGRLTIDNLHAEDLHIDAGTGSIKGTNMTAGFVYLNCGTGSIELKDVDFYSADIDSGTGSIYIGGSLKGDTTIDCGVGSLDMDLSDPKSSYSLDIEKGLGSININGSSYSSVSSDNEEATNYLSIYGGVGSINIDFAN